MLIVAGVLELICWNLKIINVLQQIVKKKEHLLIYRFQIDSYLTNSGSSRSFFRSRSRSVLCFMFLLKDLNLYCFIIILYFNLLYTFALGVLIFNWLVVLLCWCVCMILQQLVLQINTSKSTWSFINKWARK